MLLSLRRVAPSSYPRTCPQVCIPAMLAFLPSALWLVPCCPCWLSSLSAVLGFSRPGVRHMLKAMLDVSALNQSVFILKCNFQGHLGLVIFLAGMSHFYSCHVLTPHDGVVTCAFRKDGKHQKRCSLKTSTTELLHKGWKDPALCRSWTHPAPQRGPQGPSGFHAWRCVPSGQSLWPRTEGQNILGSAWWHFLSRQQSYT